MFAIGSLFGPIHLIPCHLVFPGFCVLASGFCTLYPNLFQVHNWVRSLCFRGEEAGDNDGKQRWMTGLQRAVESIGNEGMVNCLLSLLGCAYGLLVHYVLPVSRWMRTEECEGEGHGNLRIVNIRRR